MIVSLSLGFGVACLPWQLTGLHENPMDGGVR
jgi:hypothetical protein